MSEDVIEGEFVADAAAPLALRSDEPIRALVSPEEARKQWASYQALKLAIATPDDYQEFRDKKTNKLRRFPKKSFVKKIQTYFGITVQVVSADRDPLNDAHFAFRVVARAVAPNGRSVDATGACSTLEERFDLNPYGDESEQRFSDRQKKALARAYHDVLSTAETRATNRAVMNLIGGGEVTADEISRDVRPVEPSTTEPKVLQDRERARKRLFAKINEYAKHSPDGELLQNDDHRHKTLQQMYGVASFLDLTDDQLADFERKLDLRITQTRPA
ncbi:MAG TPA: hypothetical protein VGN11_09800 [Candidatus Baltobacteraceae bacterium]|jgi:hypothetical protein|nr:hypothetical protein [Candidatus Baltobacteraceae bacterium]